LIMFFVRRNPELASSAPKLSLRCSPLVLKRP
jgi:hypothetical protein